MRLLHVVDHGQRARVAALDRTLLAALRALQPLPGPARSQRPARRQPTAQLSGANKQAASYWLNLAQRGLACPTQTIYYLCVEAGVS